MFEALHFKFQSIQYIVDQTSKSIQRHAEKGFIVSKTHHTWPRDRK